MINTAPPPVHMAEVKQDKQPAEQVVTDCVNMPPDAQMNSAVLAIGQNYIKKYGPLWQALAK